MQITRNEFACKFQGTLQMGHKVMNRFGGNLGYRLGTETISPLFADLSSTRRLLSSCWILNMKRLVILKQQRKKTSITREK